MKKDRDNLRFGLMFVLRQIVIVFVAVVCAPIIIAPVFSLFRALGWHDSNAVYLWLMSGNPYFPGYVAISLLLGWLLGIGFYDKSMTWVWVLPSLVFF